MTAPDYSTDWPVELALIEDAAISDCEPVEMPVPPFVPGDRVYCARYPWSGSIEVVACEPYPGGGWRLEMRDGNYRVVAPAEHYRACPDGWTEPPMCPLEGHGYDDISRARRDALEHDSEYQARGNQWEAALMRWLDWLQLEEEK